MRGSTLTKAGSRNHIKGTSKFKRRRQRNPSARKRRLSGSLGNYVYFDLTQEESKDSDESEELLS